MSVISKLYSEALVLNSGFRGPRLEPALGKRTMKNLSLTASALAAGLLAFGTAHAAGPLKQPPMTAFYTAYYTCEDNNNFTVSYDSRSPKTATVTTSNDNKQYVLPRKPSSDGVQFAADGVKFWTDGDKVTIEAPDLQFSGCKLKAG
jgi:membrane-bound inhibitor of C-type lysozyme